MADEQQPADDLNEPFIVVKTFDLIEADRLQVECLNDFTQNLRELTPAQAAQVALVELIAIQNRAVIGMAKNIETLTKAVLDIKYHLQDPPTDRPQ